MELQSALKRGRVNFGVACCDAGGRFAFAIRVVRCSERGRVGVFFFLSWRFIFPKFGIKSGLAGDVS